MVNAEFGQITGRFSDRAMEMIDIEYLLQFVNNQQAGWWSEVQVRKWHALAVMLDLVHGGNKNRHMLVRMAQYIAITPHELRSPYTRGIVLNTTREHFPECDDVPRLQLKETQRAELDAEGFNGISSAIASGTSGPTRRTRPCISRPRGTRPS